MGSLNATPRNKIIGRLADLLQSGKSSANQYQVLPQVPLIGGTGLGDLFMGKAPELVDDISYDGLRAAVRGGNTATGGIGTYGARPAVADAALLGMDVAGLGKGLGSLSKKSAGALYDKLLEGGTSLSRRDALKKLGAIAGSTAIAGTGVGALRKLSDNVVSDAVHVAPKVADNVAAASTKNYKFNNLAEYLKYIKDEADMTMMDNYDPPSITSYEGHPDYAGDVAAWDNNQRKVVQEQLLNDEQLYNSHKAAVAAGKEPPPWSVEINPMTGEYTTIHADEVLSPQAKQEMKAFKTNVQDLHDSYIGNNSQVDWAKWMANNSSAENGGMRINRIVSGEF